MPKDAETEEPISGDKEETLPQSEPAPTSPTSPQDIKSTSAEFAKLNRNGQIATVLAKINPGLDIAKKLGQEEITSYSDTYFAKTKGDARKIATLIMNIRKSPDAFLKKVANATGIKLEPRAKAVATKVAPGTQAQLQNIKESSLIYLLQEAMIDQISDTDIRNNQDIILALLGTMYASAGNTELSIIPKDSNQAKKLKGLGFMAQPGGNYVFLTPGQTKAQAQKPDVTRVFLSMDRNPSLITALKRINTKDELKNLLVNIVNYVNKNLQSKSSDIRTTLFQVANSISLKEEQTNIDIENISKILDRYTGLKSLLDRIDTREELKQFLINLLSYVDKTLYSKRPADIRGAVFAAANTMTNAAQNQKK